MSEPSSTVSPTDAVDREVPPNRDIPNKPGRVLEVGEGFWNIRGSYKLRGLVDIGTHCSLVRGQNGKFVLLDACALSDDTRAWIEARTDGGMDIEAVIHLHPFHTMHVRSAHALYPNAKLYGTARHITKEPELPWQALRAEDPALHQAFASDLEFSVPRGVDFVSADENLHFSSVLAIHPASKTLHVDDTLCYLRMPWPIRAFKPDSTGFHPTLSKVLLKEAGAAAQFRDWARELIDQLQKVTNLCTAHSGALLERHNQGDSIAARVEGALNKVEGKLAAHEKQYG